MRNVLGVLEDDGDRLWSTFHAAVDLADREHARLTLVKTYEPGHTFAWCGPFGAGVYIPPQSEDPCQSAGRLLARAAEFVPMEMPVTSMLLGIDTEKELRRLVGSAAYDAVVADQRRLRHCRRLRRDCARDRVDVVAVVPSPHGRPDAHPPAVIPMTPAA